MHRLRVIACVAASVVVGGGVAALGQQRSGRRATKVHARPGESPPMIHAKAAEPAVFGEYAASVPVGNFATPNDAALSVLVDPQLQLDPQTTQLYQQMATTLNGSTGVPAARLAYYAAVNNQGTYSITGWGANVESVVADGNGGYNVTLSVTPGILDSGYTLNSIVSDANYMETYNVVNGTYTYIGSADPAGQAGQLPFIVQL